nr:MAG TPA: hypothetical protein [Caudoviricetes sp.]
MIYNIHENKKRKVVKTNEKKGKRLFKTIIINWNYNNFMDNCKLYFKFSLKEW